MHENRFLKVWKWVVLAAPFWWMSGLSLLFYQGVSFGLFLTLVYTFQKRSLPLYVPASFFYLFFLVLVYVFALVTHLYVAESQRIVASLYNLTYWVMGLFLIIVMANSFSLTGAHLFLAGFWGLGWMYAIFGLGVFFAAHVGIHTITFSTPLHFLSQYLGETTLVDQTLTVQLLLSDVFASLSRPRFNAFVPYPAASGAMIMMVLMMIWPRLPKTKKSCDLHFYFSSWPIGWDCL